MRNRTPLKVGEKVVIAGVVHTVKTITWQNAEGAGVVAEDRDGGSFTGGLRWSEMVRKSNK